MGTQAWKQEGPAAVIVAAPQPSGYTGQGDPLFEQPIEGGVLLNAADGYAEYYYPASPLADPRSTEHARYAGRQVGAEQIIAWERVHRAPINEAERQLANFDLPVLGWRPVFLGALSESLSAWGDRVARIKQIKQVYAFVFGGEAPRAEK
jgi:hypothetical protein